MSHALQPAADSMTAIHPKRNLGLLTGLAAFAVAVLALLALTFDGSVVWSTTVDDQLDDPSLRGRRVRLEGTLVPGTLLKRDEPCEYRFQLKATTSALAVRYPQCVIPDSLQDRPDAVVKVTVEGSLGEDNVFAATQVLAKCPLKMRNPTIDALRHRPCSCVIIADHVLE